MEERDLSLAADGQASDVAIEGRRKRAREYARRKRAELSIVHGKMLELYNELVRIGVYHKLPDSLKEFFDVYVHREMKAQLPYPGLMYKMFGYSIVPGVECTLKEAMQRLYKGKNEINFLVKRWSEKNGVAVRVVPADNGDALMTRYVIESVEPIERREAGPEMRDMMSDTESSEFRDYMSKK